MNRFRILLLSIILIWATVSLAFIVQNVNLGPESFPVKSSQGSLNLSTTNFYYPGGGNYVLTMMEIIEIFWIGVFIVGIVLFFKESLRVIAHKIISFAGIFLVLIIAYVISFYLKMGNYPASNISATFSSSNVGGTIPVIVALIVLIFLIFYIMPKGKVKNKTNEREMAESIEKMVRDLKFSDDVRGTILKVYYELSSLLKNNGIIERENLTAREFEDMSIKTLKIKKEPFETIIKLFEEARYSDHRMDDNARKMAIDALEEIKNMLEGKNGKVSSIRS